MKIVISLLLFLSASLFTVGFMNHSNSELVLSGLFIGTAIWYGISEWKARKAVEEKA